MNHTQTINISDIKGSIPALITPMHEDGSIDWKCYEQLIDWHIEQGSHALISVGTTGESPTVNVEEHLKLIETAVKHANKRIPIIAGTGGNSTQETIDLTKAAKAIGADAVLQVVPYYNKPTQEGIFQHYATVAKHVEIPSILYNVPGRTVVDMSLDTVLRLLEIPSITAIKDATGNIEKGCRLIQAVKAKRPDFMVYSGDDGTAALLMLMGAKGNMSVSANVAPKLCAQMCEAALAQDLQSTQRLHYELLKLNEIMFIESNPIPIKYAMYKIGKAPAGIRLPLTPMSASGKKQMDEALKALNLI
jgi:4-hydroxy-tetrahydrodipicolinate synthase